MYLFNLPSGKEIELKEMTGAEEEILTNQRLIKNGEAINLVLRNTILRLGEKEKPSLEDILSLLSGDRLFALVKLRQISLGEEVKLELTCNNHSCRAVNYTAINLDELPVIPYTEQREFEFILPGSGQLVRYTHLNGQMEKRLAALPDPNISSAMLIRILEIDGQAPNKKSLAEMSMRDRSALRQQMAESDAGIDTVVEVICEECGSRIRTRLEAELAFLFPGVRF